VLVRHHSWRESLEDNAEQMEICCAWCGRFRNPDNSWSQPTSFRGLTLTTHGICPTCVAAMRDEADWRS